MNQNRASITGSVGLIVFAAALLSVAPPGVGVAAAPPGQGPGGPVLVITSGANPFSSYYAEILRTEGVNAFTVRDLATVGTAELGAASVVILGEMRLSGDQATMLSTWVNAGGNLIAMRPDKQLAGLLGLTDASVTLSDAYLKIDTTRAPGAGITGQTMQFHGPADLYALSGATAVATLASDAAALLPNPAVTTRAVGAGHAAAFTYDLARSVVYTRQGNPAWSGRERDGLPPIRSNDLFFGAKAGDVQPDWVDPSKVAIPQADEQQRLLVNLMTRLSSAKLPLPRFWYFPNGNKAVVVMTGDDHGSGNTASRFDSFHAASAPGCSVANWECIRGTTYLVNGAHITDRQAAAYQAQGFEIALHPNTGCANWTPAFLGTVYTRQLAALKAQLPSMVAPSTNRTHCVAWSDWATQPKVELNNGIRFDTNYYFWPHGWVNDRPGLFTGSGMPMRFADLDGSMIDVYQAATQMTDESGQSYPATIDALLAGALGTAGYYGAFTANMHNDDATSTGADAIVASAKAHGVPVVTSRQILTWLDGRNGSSFDSVAYAGNTLTFTIARGAGANGLEAMVPASSGGKVLATISVGGTPVSFTNRTVKGVDYAVFPAVPGAYSVTYVTDTVAPPVQAVDVGSAGGAPATTPGDGAVTTAHRSAEGPT
jgi:hypothetical protein